MLDVLVEHQPEAQARIFDNPRLRFGLVFRSCAATRED